MNSTELNTGITLIITYPGWLFRVTISFLMTLFFIIFVYFTIIILNVFFTTPQVRETARYILFIHMLLNDLVYLLISFMLFTFSGYNIRVTVPICLVISSFPGCMFRITPYNLALMSLERYTAICHPLRYAELCTAQRSGLAIVYMWTVGTIPELSNVIAYCCSVDPRTFNLNVICDWRSLTVSNAQVVIKTFTDILSFSMVGLIIAYTYVKVMLVARRMDSKASKAGKTVLLHGFQLLLSMLSFTTTLTETYLMTYFTFLPYINFFLVMSLPRFVSPLIYGIRDEVFGKAMRKFHLGRMLSLCSRK
ncbi:odorant receptor 131-2-like [Hyla sarda]|uniref:odorant receptor 131-2-like n=1 Tax=Hyla sarda TaxID=327740 RepID=UPI0024C31638|nr:odorant receptor 131-2-like [Hyla sarda]